MTLQSGPCEYSSANGLPHTHWQAKSNAQRQTPIGMRRIKPLHLFWKRIALFNMFIKNIHVSLCSINLCLENGPQQEKIVFENVFVKFTKYGGSNTNTNTWFEIWSNTNTNTPYLYLYLYLQIQIRIWPQPWWSTSGNILELSEAAYTRCLYARCMGSQAS